MTKLIKKMPKILLILNNEMHVNYKKLRKYLVYSLSLFPSVRW